MKRFLTILMLSILTLTFAPTGSDAKNIVSSLEESTFFTASYGPTSFKKAATIAANLTRIGCKLQSTSSTREYEWSGKLVNATKKVYVHDGSSFTIVEYKGYPLYITIKFASSSQANTLKAQLNMEGWGYSTTGSGYEWYESLDGGAMAGFDGRNVYLNSGIE